MNILLTGGLGFIGHNVAARLEQLNHTVFIVDNKTTYGIIPQVEIDYLMQERIKKIKTKNIYIADIADPVHIPWIFRKYKPDIVIHLASFPRQKVVNANPMIGSRVMSEGLLNLLENSKKAKVKKFVYISSSMVYGDFTEHTTEEAICNPIGQYGILKYAGEWLVKDYASRKCFDYTIIRPSAVYGPLDVEDRVIAKFITAAINNKELIVNGEHEKLDFSYVDDVASGIVAAALSNNTNNKIYNISRGQSRKILDAAQIIVKLVGSGAITINKKDDAFPSRAALSIDAANRDFAYDASINIEEVLVLYYDWLKTTPFYRKNTK